MNKYGESLPNKAEYDTGYPSLAVEAANAISNEVNECGSKKLEIQFTDCQLTAGSEKSGSGVCQTPFGSPQEDPLSRSKDVTLPGKGRPTLSACFLRKPNLTSVTHSLSKSVTLVLRRPTESFQEKRKKECSSLSECNPPRGLTLCPSCNNGKIAF